MTDRELNREDADHAETGVEDVLPRQGLDAYIRAESVLPPVRIRKVTIMLSFTQFYSVLVSGVPAAGAPSSIGDFGLDGSGSAVVMRYGCGLIVRIGEDWCVLVRVGRHEIEEEEEDEEEEDAVGWLTGGLSGV